MNRLSLKSNIWYDNSKGHRTAALKGWETRRQKGIISLTGKLSAKDKEWLNYLKGQVEQGEPKQQGKFSVQEDKYLAGTPESTYPEWMQNRGWTKKEVLAVIDKIKKGSPFRTSAKKQQVIAYEIKSQIEYWKDYEKFSSSDDIPAKSLKKGQRMTIGGEKFKVIDDGKKSGEIKLKDGFEFFLEPHEILQIDQGSLRGNPEYGRYTKEDLRDIINTWSMFGTDALCKKVKSGWIVDFRSFGFPIVFKTKHEAIKRADQWVDALVKLRREGLQKNPTNLKLHHCPQADKEHKHSKRQYAHVGHHKGAICVADAFFDLPHEHYCAILIHEIGHLMGGKTEAKANQLIKKKYGVKMQYKNSKYGDKLEYLPRNEIQKVLRIAK